MLLAKSVRPWLSVPAYRSFSATEDHGRERCVDGGFREDNGMDDIGLEAKPKKKIWDLKQGIRPYCGAKGILALRTS